MGSFELSPVQSPSVIRGHNSALMHEPARAELDRPGQVRFAVGTEPAPERLQKGAEATLRLSVRAVFAAVTKRMVVSNRQLDALSGVGDLTIRYLLYSRYRSSKVLEP